nr:hypothetical protein [Hyphomonas sp. Mor2]
MTLTSHSVRFAASIAAGLATLGTASADYQFCNPGVTCKYIEIKNTSSALVTSVKIEQHTTDGACEYADATISQNLNGMYHESYDVAMSVSCKYKVKFHTTSGCSGDKTTHFTPDNFEDKKSGVLLKGACGTLKTSKY